MQICNNFEGKRTIKKCIYSTKYIFDLYGNQNNLYQRKIISISIISMFICSVFEVFKVIVTVFSSGCLQIGFGVLIIDCICNFLI